MMGLRNKEPKPPKAKSDKKDTGTKYQPLHSAFDEAPPAERNK